VEPVGLTKIRGTRPQILREGFLRSSANSRAFARGRGGVSCWNSIPSQFYQETFERQPRRPLCSELLEN
jgi:hypothetical protein